MLTTDGKVTASDLTELRKLILGVTNALPKNASWNSYISTIYGCDQSIPFCGADSYQPDTYKYEQSELRSSEDRRCKRKRKHQRG